MQSKFYDSSAVQRITQQSMSRIQPHSSTYVLPLLFLSIFQEAVVHLRHNNQIYKPNFIFPSCSAFNIQPKHLTIGRYLKQANEMTTIAKKTRKSPLFSRTSTLLFLESSSRDDENNSKPTHSPDTVSYSNNDNLGVHDSTTLGNLLVPSIGIGTIAWSANDNSKEISELQNVVRTACDMNGAFFDTAERYGSNLRTALGLGWGETEKLTGKLLTQYQSDQESYKNTKQCDNQNKQFSPIIATKFTPTPWRTTADSVVQACIESQERLGVDQIDLYQLHMPDIVQPLRRLGVTVKSKDEIYWDGLAKCYHLGLVKNVGVCNYGPTLLQRCQDELAKRNVPLASNQIAYSLIGRHNGSQKTVDVCHERNIRVLAYYPFAMGLLTGKYATSTTLDNKEAKRKKLLDYSLVSSKKTKLELRDLKRYMYGDGRKVPLGGIGPLVRIMEMIAVSRGKSVAQVALNYIMCKNVIPIPGARTAEQVRDNLGAMNWRLTPTEVAMLEQVELGFGFDGAGFKRTNEKFVGYGVEKWALD